MKRKIIFVFLILISLLSFSGCVNQTPKCNHESSEWIIDVDATCSKEGHRYQECLICHKKIKEEMVTALGHDYVNNVCTRCDDSLIVVNFLYELNSSGTGYIISGIDRTKENKDLSVVIIPTEYRNLPVVAIKAGAFKDETEIRVIKVPNSVTSIGKGAFQGCNSLVKLTIPFIGTTEEATTKDSVFGIIFGYTTNLSTTQVVTSQGKGYTYQYTYIYSTSSTMYGYYIPETLREVIVTKQTKIPSNAFYNCDLIEKITIREDVETIGSNAFYNCKGLKQLNSEVEGLYNIPKSVEKISSNAFYNCEKLEEVTMSDEVTSIGSNAFYGCIKLTKFNTENENEINVPTKCKEVGNEAFYNVKLVTTILVPNSVTSIGKGAFQGCNSLVKLTIPFIGTTEEATTKDSVFGIIFGYTTNLSTTQVVTSQGKGYTYIYSTSSTMYGYYIPETLREVIVTKQTKIPSNAFYNCDLIEKITIREDVETIGSNAFYNCKGLK